METPKGGAMPTSVSAAPSMSTVESHWARLHDGVLYSTTGFCGTNAVLLGLASVLTSEEQAQFKSKSMPYMLLEELAHVVQNTLKHSLVRHMDRIISTQVEFENNGMGAGGKFLCSPLLHDGTSNHLVFIDATHSVSCVCSEPLHCLHGQCR